MSRGPSHFQSSMILRGQAVLLGLGKHREGGQEKGEVVKTCSSSQMSSALVLKRLPSLLSRLSDGKENGQ